MKNQDILEPELFYHIYNRAVGSEQLFQHNYEYGQFLYKWQTYISPLAHTYAFCLMPNHVHFLVRFKSVNEIDKTPKNSNWSFEKLAVQQFSNFFNSYAKSFNFRHGRMGKLFMLPFKRKLVDSDDYFTQLVYYIHRNPLHHGILMDPSKWEYSSYRELIHNDPTWLHRNVVLEWFGGHKKFVEYHQYMNLLNV